MKVVMVVLVTILTIVMVVVIMVVIVMVMKCVVDHDYDVHCYGYFDDVDGCDDNGGDVYGGNGEDDDGNGGDENWQL